MPSLPKPKRGGKSKLSLARGPKLSFPHMAKPSLARGPKLTLPRLPKLNLHAGPKLSLPRMTKPSLPTGPKLSLPRRSKKRSSRDAEPGTDRKPKLAMPKLSKLSLARGPELKLPNLAKLRPKRTSKPSERGESRARRPNLRLPRGPNMSLASVSSLSFVRRRGADVVGLDIQPGFVAAVKVRVNGSLLAERAAALPLPADTVREGEVVNRDQLTETLRELFADHHLGKHVRVGIANQRTVMRTLELPPVTDRKELAAAVRFQAQDQVPMPLDNAVLDFHPLGMVDTPAGTRQRVVLVAAQRDMIENLLAAIRAAGLQPQGVDMSAFALIRSLHRHEPEQADRVLYLNVDGLTNLAIADGTTCRFTRVVGAGLEGMASQLAAQRNVPIADARALLYAVDLATPPVQEPPAQEPVAEPDLAVDAPQAELAAPQAEPAGLPDAEATAGEPPLELEQTRDSDAEQPQAPASLSVEEHEARERTMGYAESMEATRAPAPTPQSAPSSSDADVRAVLESGIREISGEVRNSLDFYRSQEEGGQVSHVLLSGAALDVPGFADALQSSLGLEVRSASVGLAEGKLDGQVSASRLSIAAGLATVEAPQ